MATLSGNKIKDTYQSLVKFSDNGNITTSAKQLTDGFGNNSPMYVSTTQVGIGVTPESGLNLHVYGDAKIGSNLTIIGNLVVEGSTTTVGTDTLTVKDPLIVLANNNTSTDAVDIGFYGKYTPSGTTLYSGLFREALTGKYRLFKDLQVEPTTTVNTSGTGYAQATLIAALEGNVTGNITGNVTGNLTGNVTGDVTGDLTGNVIGGTISGTTGTFSGNVDIDGTLDVDDVISVEGSAFGRIEIGGASGGYVDLKAPNSDDYDLRLITSVGGAELLSIDTLKFYTGATTDLAFSIDASQNATFENNVTIPATPTADTHAASKGYVDAAVEGQDTLAEILAIGNTTGGTDIAVSAGDDITFTDTSKAYFGTGNDLEIYHDGSNAKIENSTGDIEIRQNTDDGLIRFYNDNGSGQIQPYITLDGSVKQTKFTVDTLHEDGFKALFGTGSDLQIYHNAFDSYINNSGTGDLIFTSGINERMRIQSGGDVSINEANPLNSSKFYVNGFGYSTAGWSVGNSSGTIRGRLTTSGSILQIQSEENNDIQIGDTTSANIIHIDTSEDSVGIGLTNPADYTADELVISVPDESGMTLVSGTTDAAYISFADATGTDSLVNYIRYDHNDDTMSINNFGGSIKFSTGEAINRMTINTAGVTVDDDLIVDGNVKIKKSITNNETLLGIEASGAGTTILGSITYDQTNDTMRLLNNSDFTGTSLSFGTRGNDILSIDYSGNSTFSGSVTAGGTDDGTALFLKRSGGANVMAINTNADGSWTMFDYAASSYTSGITQKSGNVGIGETNPQRPLHINGTEGVARFTSTASGNNGFEVGIGTSSQAFLWQSENSYMQFATNNTERMRIDSSGAVLIGATSALDTATRFQVSGNSSGVTSFSGNADDVIIEHNANVGITLASPNTTSQTIAFADPESPNAGFFLYDHSVDALRIGTNGTEKMRIDSSGNVGIGVADGDIFGRFYGRSVGIGGGAAISKLQIDGTSYSGIDLGKGGTRYGEINASDTGLDLSSLGATTLKMYTNATERMRIDSSGNIFATNSSGNLVLGNAASGDVYLGGGNQNTSNIILQTGSSEKMRIDSSGNVAVGSDTPLYLYSEQDIGQIAVNRVPSTGVITDTSRSAAYINLNASNGGSSLTFHTANANNLAPTERMRITSGGYLNAGAYTSSSNTHHKIVTTRASSETLRVENNSTTPYGQIIRYGGATPNTTDNWFLVCEDQTLSRLIIWSNGNVVNRNNSYGSLSDVKLKENIVDATPKLDDLMKVKIRNYNLIGDDKKQIGVIAQELEDVFPNMIDESIDFEDKEITDEEGNVSIEKIDLGTTTKSVKYSVFVPMLIKSIQELKAEIDELKTQINN